MEMKSERSGVLEAMVSHLKELEGLQTQVGWFETAKYEDGTPVAYVASIQEFGVPERSLPARPFMRPTVAEQSTKWKDLAEKLSLRVIDGKMSPHDALEVIGLTAEGDVSKMIASITSPPLSPITLLARAARQRGEKVTGATIGQFANQVKGGVTASMIAGVSTKPLNDTGYMIATLTHVVENA